MTSEFKNVCRKSWNFFFQKLKKINNSSLLLQKKTLRSFSLQRAKKSSLNGRNWWKTSNFKSFWRIVHIFQNTIGFSILSPADNNSVLNPMPKTFSGVRAIFCPLSRKESRLFKIQKVSICWNGHIDFNFNIFVEKQLTRGFFSCYENFQCVRFFSFCSLNFLNITQQISECLIDAKKAVLTCLTKNFGKTAENVSLEFKLFWTKCKNLTANVQN